MLFINAATIKPYQTYHKEVAKMLGATEEELNELAGSRERLSLTSPPGIVTP